MNRHLLAIALVSLISCDQQAQPERTSVNPRAALLQRIGDINDFDRPRPLVSLELFFEGNEDYGSIGYNLPDPPEPRDFYDLLKELRDRDDVHDVLIEVKDLEDPDGWPSTDTIWFITRASPDDVRQWFPERLDPDDVIIGFDQQQVEPYEVPAGHEAIAAWYD